MVIGANPAELPRGSNGNSRAFDARTGRKLWEFDTVPQSGVFGFGGVMAILGISRNTSRLAGGASSSYHDGSFSMDISTGIDRYCRAPPSGYQRRSTFFSTKARSVASSDG